MAALHAYIVAFLLIHLSMQKSVGFVSGNPGDPLDGAGLFRRLLLCQPFTGLVQPFLPALHAELGLVELGLFAVGMELLATVTRSSPALGLFCLFSIGGVLRLGGQQVVDLATGETVNKRDGDAAIEQQALAGVGLRDIR